MHTSSRQDARPFAALLPHGMLLDDARGIVLLATPRLGGQALALGSAWELTPVNMEVCSEEKCQDIARRHENLIRGLPIGSAVQAMATIVPADEAQGWEQRRHDIDHPVVQSQRGIIRRGMPYRDHTAQGGLRHVHTLVTLRIPLPDTATRVSAVIRACLGMDQQGILRSQEVLARHLAPVIQRYRGYQDAVYSILHDAGHRVTPLTGTALAHSIARALWPAMTAGPSIQASLPLAEQVLTHAARREAWGWRMGEEEEELTCRVLSLHRPPPKTYPGILIAPRAPEGSELLALWQAWSGPLTLVTNIAVVDQGVQMAQLKRKRNMAFIQRLNPLGAASIENKALEKELADILENSFLTQGQVTWARVHLVLWGPAQTLPRGVEEVIQASRRYYLEFLPEPTLGGTLFLQTVPLGFDPAWPKESVLRRARHIPSLHIANLMPLYGGMRGTKSASILYLNQRGEEAAFSPFDDATAPHMLIVGMSGAGKSFTMAHLVNQVLPLGARVVILDRLPSYKELCAAHGGRYVEMDFNTPLCFNPFFGPLDKAHVAFITAALAEMASGGVERLSREALGVLADAVAYYVATLDKSRGEPTLSMFAGEVLRQGGFAPNDARARRLGQDIARKLQLFYGRGPYAGFVDGPNTFVIDHALTVVELSKLKESPDLQGSILFALMHQVTQFFSAPELQQVDKYFGSDETWAFLKHDATAEVMEEISRTYRKLRTSAIFMSQQGSDYDTPAGRVLRANAPIKIFLQQDMQEIEAMRQQFQLTPQEVTLIKKAQKTDAWSTAYLQLPGQQGGLVRLVPDEGLQWLVSQHPDDIRRRRAALETHGGNWEQALASVIQGVAE